MFPATLPTTMPQVKLRPPWSGALQPLSVGYFKGRTRVMVLLCVLAIVKEIGVDLSEAQKCDADGHPRSLYCRSWHSQSS